MHYIKILLNIIILTFMIFPFYSRGNSYFGIETGVVKNAYNNQRIPGKGGTLFDMAPSFDENNSYYRLSYHYLSKDRSGFRFLYAPLSLTGEKKFEKDIDFKGTLFESSDKTHTSYKFNSYRGTYFYQVIKSKAAMVNIGGTLKIRDAKVLLKQGDLKKFKENVGVVPLLYLYSEYRWDNGARIALDFDGLVASQGRAIDLAFMGGYYLNSFFRISLGYRMLEGGADNEKVYNFSLFHYYFTSLDFSF
jgi:hypothetical protein